MANAKQKPDTAASAESAVQHETLDATSNVDLMSLDALFEMYPEDGLVTLTVHVDCNNKGERQRVFQTDDEGKRSPLYLDGKVVYQDVWKYEVYHPVTRKVVGHFKCDEARLSAKLIKVQAIHHNFINDYGKNVVGLNFKVKDDFVSYEEVDSFVVNTPRLQELKKLL